MSSLALVRRTLTVTAGGKSRPGSGSRSTSSRSNSGSFQKSRFTRSGRNLNDPFFKNAKSEGYVARSAYKLLEIQQKHKVIPQGGYVLDLGCHPGAWLQVACQSIGPPSKGGLVLGIDLQETLRPGRFCDDRVKILRGDAREVDGCSWKSYTAKGLDCVLSDMCHWTHGNSVIDSAKSLELARTAFEISLYNEEGYCLLKPGGNLVMKILQGAGIEEFAKELKAHYKTIKHHRPKATRSESKEVFLIGLGKLP
jgi:23S rRNA (uridine2552-2'-O)-methyltransferase